MPTQLQLPMCVGAGLALIGSCFAAVRILIGARKVSLFMFSVCAIVVNFRYFWWFANGIERI
jgi:hypothetical protein